MKIIQLVTFTLSVTLISGCVVSKSKYEKSQEEIKLLKGQLDECQNGASRLYSSAISLYENKEYRDCQSKIRDLLNKHPESQEAKDAKVLLKTVESKIAEIDATERKVGSSSFGVGE